MPSPPPSAILVNVRHAVFQLDAGQQLLAHAFFQLAQRTHGVFAVDVVARVHQPVGQVARGREQQQAFGVEVEAADGQPFAGLHGRQAVEYRRTAFRIVVADDFAGRLVVHQHARRLAADLALNQLAVDAHRIGRQDALADVGRLAVDRHAAGDDQVFHVAARTEAGFGQHLVQLRRVVVRGQVAAHRLWRLRTAAFVGVERVRGDVRERRIGVVHGAASCGAAGRDCPSCSSSGAACASALRSRTRTALADVRLGSAPASAAATGFALPSAASTRGLRASRSVALFAHLARAARRTRAALLARRRRFGLLGGGCGGGAAPACGWPSAAAALRRARLAARRCRLRGLRPAGASPSAAARRLLRRRASAFGASTPAAASASIWALVRRFGLAACVGIAGWRRRRLDLWCFSWIHCSFLGCADLAQRQPLILAQGRE